MAAKQYDALSELAKQHRVTAQEVLRRAVRALTARSVLDTDTSRDK
jgi:hypothetical protein